MLFRPLLLMTLPPGDDDLTRPGAPYIPDMADNTQPMGSPYPVNPGVPPPPPGTGPVPAWRPARPAPPDYASPPRSNGLLIIAGVLVAVALVVFGGIAFALAQSRGNTPQGSGPVVHSATATPAPTKAPTVTPTTQPTATSTPDDQDNGDFASYTNDPFWTMKYPNGANVQTGIASAPQGFPASATVTTFSMDQGAQLQIEDLPAQVPGDPLALLNAIVTQAGLQDVRVISQGPVQYNNSAWQSLHVRGSASGTRFDVVLLYGTHDSGSTIVRMSAPVKNFGDVNNNAFQPMMDSFTYTSP